MKYYVGPYKILNDGNFSYFAAQSGSVNLFDLRNISQKSNINSRDGYGIFKAEDNVKLDDEYELISAGNDILNTDVSSLTLSLIESKLKFKAKSRKLHNLIEELVTDYSDPNGESACKPLIPDDNNNLVFTGLFNKKCDWNNKHGKKVISLLKKDLEKTMNEAKSNNSNIHRKNIKVLMNQYGLSFNDLKPNTWHDKETPLQPETTITESFTTANSTTLGPNLTWSDVIGTNGWRISSNKAVPAQNGTYATERAETALSSANHWCQFTLDALNSSFIGRIGPCTRFSNSAETCYWVQCYRQGASSNIGIFTVVAGTGTLITSTTSATFTSARVVRLHSNGSSHTSFLDGVSQEAITDTTISGNLKTGIRGFNTHALWTGISLFSASDGLSSSGGSNSSRKSSLHKLTLRSSSINLLR